MNTPVLLISESELKKITPIYANVESADLLPYIIEAQDIEIQKLLGTELFNYIIAGVSGNTLNSDELALVEVIKPCLGHYVVTYSIPFNWAKFTARGISQKTTDHSNPTSLKDAENLAEKSRDKAQYYAQRVIDYMLNPKNVGKFPLYYAANAREVKPERDTTYQSGIYLNDVEGNMLNSGWI